jgi:hypothetical protein
MNQIAVGHYEQDGGLVYIPIGFIPDYLLLCDLGADTAIVFYHWWERQEDDEASGKQEGVSVTEGVTANLADSGGITAYDTGTEAPTVNSWTTARSTAATARTATANGTFIKPTTSGLLDTGEAADISLVFECVTAGTGGSSEPAWNPSVGENTVDGSTVWECIPEPTVRKGYKGVAVAAALQTDGQEMYYLGFQADSSEDLGDSGDWTDGVYGT